MRLTITARARADIDDARDWYAGIQSTLGEELLADIDATVATILERPASFPDR